MTSQGPLISNPGIWGHPSSAAGQKVLWIRTIWVRAAWPGVQPQGTPADGSLTVLSFRPQSQERGRR